MTNAIKRAVLTCYQVGEGPRRALQLRCSGWVSLHVLSVALINTSQFIDVLFNV